MIVIVREVETETACSGSARGHAHGPRRDYRIVSYRIIRPGRTTLCMRAGARRARASLVSDVEKKRQTVSDYTAGRYLE